MDIGDCCDYLLNPTTRFEIIRAVRLTAPKSWQMEERQHDDTIVYLILNGSCSGQVDRRACTWRTGELWWLAPQVLHEMRPDKGPQLRFYVLRANWRMQHWPRRCLRLLDGRPCQAAFAQLVQACAMPGRQQKRRQRCALVNLLAQMDESEQNQTPAERGRLSIRQQRACSLLLARKEASQLDPEALAAACGLGLPHFRRRFRMTYGCSPRTWLARERIHTGAELLRFSGMSIEAAAEACGYASTPAFCRCFKQVMGVSPARWRDQ